MITGNQTREEPSRIHVGGTEICESKKEKMLGMTISQSLSWKSHFSELERKLNGSRFAIRRLRGILPKKDLTGGGEALFYSHLRYGLAACGKIRFNETDPINGEMKRMQMLQNSVMRTVLIELLKLFASSLDRFFQFPISASVQTFIDVKFW